MGRNTRTMGSSSFKLRREGVGGCVSRIRMRGHTIASQVDTGKGGKGRKEEREGGKEEGKSGNLKNCTAR